MRKLLLVAAIALFAITGCKKSSDNNNNGVGTLTVNIDGTSTIFNTNAMAQMTTVGSDHFLSIFGFKGTPGASNQLTVSIHSENPISAKTYTENGIMEVAGIGYSEYATSTNYANSGSTSNPVTITITSITATNVQGTFSGLLENTGGGGATKALTSGSFNLNF